MKQKIRLNANIKKGLEMPNLYDTNSTDSRATTSTEVNHSAFLVVNCKNSLKGKKEIPNQDDKECDPRRPSPNRADLEELGISRVMSMLDRAGRISRQTGETLGGDLNADVDSEESDVMSDEYTEENETQNGALETADELV